MTTQDELSVDALFKGCGFLLVCVGVGIGLLLAATAYWVAFG